MALINKSFTFVECDKCHQTMKLEVGKAVDGIRCECETKAEIKPAIEEPKRRMVRKKEDVDAG